MLIDQLFDALLSFNHKGVLQILLVVAVSLSLGFLAYFLLLKVLRRWTAGTSPDLEKAVNRYCRLPLLSLLPIVALTFSSSFVSLSPDLAVSVKRTHSLLLIAVVTWLFISSIRVVE